MCAGGDNVKKRVFAWPVLFMVCGAALLVTACGGGSISAGHPDGGPQDDADAQSGDEHRLDGADAGGDAKDGVDAGRDAGADAGPDAGGDAGVDGEADAGADAASDAGHDAGYDAGDGPTEDAGTDAGADTGETGCVEGAIREEDCVVQDGTGRRTITCSDGAWLPGECLIVVCDEGFFPQAGACLPLDGREIHRIEPKVDLSNLLEVALEASIAAESYTLDRVEKNGLASGMPAHASLDEAGGVFSWTPTPSQVAFYVFEVIAEDAGGATEPIEVLVEIVMPAICTEAGEPCTLLQQQWDAGLAAGHLGDWYHNCDGFHTNLNMGLFPQLDRMTTSGCDTEYGNYPDRVVIGNESCALTSGENWSSIARIFMRWEGQAQQAYDQYLANDHYWYPEHRDHDEVDYFHGKMPTLAISQGSSGSEMDEVKRFVYTLAAFRPDTKRALVAAGMLMPTVQMIFRRARAGSDAAYLTGEAHPSAYDNLSATMEMVEMANAIPADGTPPMVQLEVVDETYDVVEGKNERWFTLPVTVCRIFRGLEYTKFITVSAEASFDLNDRPLTYHWVVLRGDPEHVRINPVDGAGAIVEIQIDYHPKAPIGETTRLSNMVEVGAFVHNGLYYSAPAFVTSYTLDNEERVYDADGNLTSHTTNDNYVYPPLL